MIIQSKQQVDEGFSFDDIIAGQQSIPGHIYSYGIWDNDKRWVISLNEVSSDGPVMRGHRKAYVPEVKS